MKSNKIIYIILLLIVNLTVNGQQTNTSWEKLNHLIGEWVGEGNGEPGQGDGSFSFKTDLNGKILVRNNHTIFPETADSKALVHDDLLIVYQSTPEGSQEAIYFDNEGNTIKYKVIFSDKSIVLTSDINTNSPRFRLTYVKIDSKTITVTFEMASPQTPEVFKIYLTGKAFKIK
jgi:hypothetical protein